VGLSEGNDDAVVVTWLEGAGAVGAPTLPRAARVLVVGPDGSVIAEHAFATPPGLAARRGSTEQVGAVFTGDGALFLWIETATTTAADGTTQRSAALVLQRVGLDGQAGET
jgi:hypothetical protein